MFKRTYLTVPFIGYALGISMGIGVLQSCGENVFPVSDLPEAFEFIPPDDVYMLSAQSSDEEITLSWNPAQEGVLKAIHVTNQTTGETKDLPGDACGVSFANLTNYVRYTFIVKTESQNGQNSYGVTISAKPFKHDDVNPGRVQNLHAYIVNGECAYLEWDSPSDEDVEWYVIESGGNSKTVSSENIQATIIGNLDAPISVKAIDYSGNVGNEETVMAKECLIEIVGWDNGDTQTVTDAIEFVQIRRNPTVRFIDKYEIVHSNPSLSGIGGIIDKPEAVHEFNFEMNLLNSVKLWNDDAKTIGNWTLPIEVSVYSEGALIGTKEYLTYNNVPGTIMLDHCKYIQNGKQNNDGKCYDCVLGNTSDNGYSSFDINVLEDGDYEVVTWFSNGEADREYRFYLDDKLDIDYKVMDGVEPDYAGVEGFKTGGWNDYQPSTTIVTMHLTKGMHKMAFFWPQGGHNFKKLVFTKKG